MIDNVYNPYHLYIFHFQKSISMNFPPPYFFGMLDTLNPPDFQLQAPLVELYRFGPGDVVSKKDRHFLVFNPAGKTRVESGYLSDI